VLGTIYAPQITETGLTPAREMSPGEGFTVPVFRLYRFIVLTDGNQ
jgi:hypothetical protein